jgi:cytidylate kinase
VCRIYNVTEEKARVMIEDNDYTREVFTKSFTGKDRYDARNYDLTLDVSSLGIQGTIDFLLAMFRP